ncbi:hypothetical protein [Embleya sp. MST-111070]|uniref:hypothetical protein n=1 Tax=Embleya sp. MST-111070 TaxID=3398231 RepID=UPI003F73BA5A
MDAYLDRSLAEMEEVEGARLAEYLGRPRAKVDLQPHRALRQTLPRVGLLAAARAAQSCPVAAALPELAGLAEPDRAGPELSPAGTEYKALRRHAEDCLQCTGVANDAVDEQRWALGPGLVVLAAREQPDEQKRRRAAIVWCSAGQAERVVDGPRPAWESPAEAGRSAAAASTTPPALPGGVPATVIGGSPGGPTGGLVRLARPVAVGERAVKDAALRQVLRIPGVGKAATTAVRTVYDNPMAVRLGGAGAGLVVGPAPGTAPIPRTVPVPSQPGHRRRASSDSPAREIGPVGLLSGGFRVGRA